jgi:hypothetical protein
MNARDNVVPLFPDREPPSERPYEPETWRDTARIWVALVLFGPALVLGLAFLRWRIWRLWK